MEEAILTEFEAIGVELQDGALGKCVEICTLSNISDAEEFVEQWMAYSISNFNGAEPTVVRLNEFQLKGFPAKDQYDSVKISEPPPASDDFRSFSNKRSRPSNANSILNTYGYNETVSDKELLEPGKITNSAPAINGKEEDTIGTKAAAALSGQVVFNFGKAKKMTDFRRETPLLFELTSGMAYEEKYLFEMIPEKAAYQREVLFNLGKEFTDKVKFQDSKRVDRFSAVDAPSQQVVHCIGRISGEGDAKLTPNSTVLIGTDSDTVRRVSVNFSKCASLSVFPGQTVYVTGLNPNGTTLYVDHVHAERELIPPAFPLLDSPMDIVIAAGPFSAPDNLKYAALEKLLSFCQNNNPDLLILLGPFVDEANTQMDVLNEGYDVFFEKMVANIMEHLKESSVQTKVMLVASQDDLNSTGAFPTHPLRLAANYPNLKLLPDPCQLTLDGISFGFSATDVLAHLGEDELAINSGGDKVKRHVRHLFNQKSFYPISPPHLGVNLDVGLLSKYGRLRSVPNIIVLPSTTKPFVRLIDGCLALNPGKWASDKPTSSYARLIVNPKPSKDANLMEFLSCQIINL